MKGWTKEWLPRYASRIPGARYEEVELVMKNDDFGEDGVVRLVFKYNDWLKFLDWATAEREVIKRWTESK